MVKSKVIKCAPYFQDFKIVFYDDMDEVQEKFNVTGLKGVGGVYADDSTIVAMVYLLSHEEHSVHPLTALAHEVDHAVDILYKLKNIKKTEGVDEHHAYLLSWLFGEGLKMYLKMQDEIEENFE